MPLNTSKFFNGSQIPLNDKKVIRFNGPLVTSTLVDTDAFGKDTTEYEIIGSGRFRTVVSLSAGTNTISHGLGYSEVMVSTRDDATGQEINIPVTNETVSSVDLNPTIAISNVRITIR